MRKAGVVIAAAAWLVFLLVGVNGWLKELGAAEEPEAYNVTVIGENTNYGNDYLTVDICRPVVSGFADTEFEQSLNDRIGAQISTALDDAEDYAETDGRGIGYPCVFYAAFDAKCIAQVLSLAVSTFLDNGGTGMPRTRYYNADIAQHRYVTLDDLFIRDAPYRACIDAVILETMHKDPGRYFLEQFTGVDSNTSFFIAGGRLYIAFAKYEIASGMTGEPKFMIPDDAIRDLIKPVYQRVFDSSYDLPLQGKAEGIGAHQQRENDRHRDVGPFIFCKPCQRGEQYGQSHIIAESRQ